MTEQHDPDIIRSWTLYRGSEPSGMPRFHLRAEVKAEFVEPTRDEVRTALEQILDEALGPADLFPTGTDTTVEIAGWDPSTPMLVPLTELEHLRAWKTEALPLLDILEQCHTALPSPFQAKLGESKAKAVLHYIRHSEPIGVYDEEPPGSPDG